MTDSDGGVWWSLADDEAAERSINDVRAILFAGTEPTTDSAGQRASNFADEMMLNIEIGGSAFELVIELNIIGRA